MQTPTFLSKEQQAQIQSAIKEAELNTSGEIRVHLETDLEGDVLDRAAWIFKKIGMHKTELRNGVLFYLSITKKKFAVIGDAGINRLVPEDFWDKIREILEENFRDGRFTEGLVQGILMAGSQLKTHFPYEKEDINELPDTISFDNPE